MLITLYIALSALSAFFLVKETYLLGASYGGKRATSFLFNCSPVASVISASSHLLTYFVISECRKAIIWSLGALSRDLRAVEASGGNLVKGSFRNTSHRKGTALTKATNQSTRTLVHSSSR